MCALFGIQWHDLMLEMEFKLFLIITLFAYGWYSVVDLCHTTIPHHRD